MKKLLILAINLYQKTLSPDHGVLFRGRYPNGYCKYYPTCSEYAKQAIAKNGSIKGTLMATKRIIKCNPLSRGGLDPV